MSKEIKYNAAQTILIAIGGTGVFVGGYKGNAIPDLQQSKKARKGKKAGLFGKGLIAAITAKQLERLRVKKLFKAA
jgi:hypothetical protein